jgi:DNA polymerase-3 subunit delta
MRIQAKDLSLHLKKGLAHLYLVFGDEPLHHQEAILAIRAEAKNQGYNEREVFEVTAHFEWESLLQSIKSPSLFSEKRLIECRLQEGKIGKTGADTLIKLANTYLDDQTILFFTTGKVDTATQSSAWFTTLERKGHTVWARALSGEETLAWLKTRCLAAGFQPTLEAIHALFERTEGNCLAAAQAIEKLDLFYLQSHSPSSPANTNTSLSRPLTVTDILNTADMDARFSLFDLVDAALLGSTARTTRIFESLRSEGVDPILVLWAIAREVRAIIPLARQIKTGRSEKEVFNQYGVWKRRESAIRQCVQRFSLSTFHQLLVQAQHVDDTLKGRNVHDGWSQLFMLCLALAGHAGVYHD